MKRLVDGIPHTHQRAAFPLGGIGTGNVSVGTRGELRDWELENRPDKGRRNPFSFFAIYAKPEGRASVTRVLEARHVGRHDWEEGYPADALAGLPRLAGSTMYGRYPVADIEFEDDVLPVDVSLRTFTPLVPLDPDASGIPGAVLRYRVHNPGSRPVAVTVVGSVSHTAGRGEGAFGMRARQSVRWRDDGTVRGLDFGVRLPEDDFGYGTLALTTTDASVTSKPQWVTGFWPDGPRLFWNDLTEDGLLGPEPRLTLEDRPRSIWADRAGEGDSPLTEEELFDALPRLRTGSLGIVHRLAPGESKDFEFVLTWSFPNRRRAWCGKLIAANPHKDEVVLNHFATLWPTAWDAATYLHSRLVGLERQTNAFVDALYGGSIPPVLAESIGANLATLRSTTCFVLESPNRALGSGPVFAAWEGSFDREGSCEGTCTHVWSYAQSMAWLFPTLERSARRVEYLLETEESGAQKFRSNKIFDSPAWFMGPAVDGQLGTLIRLYREWRFSGDMGFLAELWPAATRALDYAISEWDRDGDGLLDGELHNTYDIEFYGIEPLANGLFVTALCAAARMADAMGEPERAADWRRRSEQAARKMDDLLWNGEFYEQVIDDVNGHRYQYGRGVLSDQLLGQFHAYINGLGELLPSERIRGALTSVMTYNFRHDLTEHESTQRTYALNDEGGLLLASWPRGGRPEIPFVYSDEVWTGIEHHVAATLLYAGMPSDALEIEQTSRARYDGIHRNPWDEIECGNHYARSLSSWALLLGISGVQWDAPTRSLSFTSPEGPELQTLFTTAVGWGQVRIVKHRSVTLTVLGGELGLGQLFIDGDVVATDIDMHDGERQTFALS